MAITTLARYKEFAGTDLSDTTDDYKTLEILRSVSMAILRYLKSNPGFEASLISEDSPAVITSYGHGLKTGDVVQIYDSDSTTSIDGTQTVTRIDSDKFSVPIDNSAAGSYGETAWIVKVYTEYYSGDGTAILRLRNRPVISIGSVYLDSGAYYEQAPNAFAASTLLTAGTDYVLEKNSAVDTAGSKGGRVLRTAGSWSSRLGRIRGLLAGVLEDGKGNIKITYTAGYSSIVWDIQLAAHRMMQRQLEVATGANVYASESYENYSYSRVSAGAQAVAGPLGVESVVDLLAPYKMWPW